MTIEFHDAQNPNGKSFQVKDGEHKEKWIYLKEDFKPVFKIAFFSELGDKTSVLLVILVISWCNKKKKLTEVGDLDL